MPHRAFQERPVGLGNGGDLGELLGDLIGCGAVGGVVILALEPVVVHAGDVRLGRGEGDHRGGVC